eukprot:scaffold12597_cov86-Attheya_sp.AAC.1
MTNFVIYGVLNSGNMKPSEHVLVMASFGMEVEHEPHMKGLAKLEQMGVLVHILHPHHGMTS